MYYLINTKHIKFKSAVNIYHNRILIIIIIIFNINLYFITLMVNDFKTKLVSCIIILVGTIF